MRSAGGNFKYLVSRNVRGRDNSVADSAKVLHEDDLTVNVEHNVVTSNHKVSPSPPEVLTPKVSANVLVPVKAREAEDVSEKSRYGAP
ncbi:hypothetical protein GH714_031383 [Hevea brasiliensis]|uniref:Uncharacterized protein n=1 Tax=Hevea brasiliensis TaxID=3981 RepID=A0A6A6LG79_HEVBR|nr:hypothetical protein GH714_031383 [Hevea brasiliensis]